jgi:hypothetical protein
MTMDSFTANNDYVEAEVYKETGNPPVWLVKVKFLEAGLYINGIRVQDSLKYPGELWVQLPAYKVGFRWQQPIECDKSAPFWKMVEDKACEAVKNYRDFSDAPAADTPPGPTYHSDEESSGNNWLNDMPF